jgi:hypothetical protein
MPPSIERPLHLICSDSVIREADPTESLYKVLASKGFNTFAAAKTLTAESQHLQNVAAVARERFLNLLKATPTTAGTLIYHL